MRAKKSWVPEDVAPDTLAWLAGLLEGEGSFFLPSTTERRPHRYPVIKLGMTDEDVVVRVATLFGRAITTTRGRHSDKFKYSTAVEGKAAGWWMERLYPHMGARRRQKIVELLGHEPTAPLVRHDWYWLAGLCEGEACFDIARGHPRLRLNMVDEDVIARAADLFGVGFHVQHTPFMRSRGWRPQFSLAVAHSRGRNAMARMSPMMGSRRRARIEEVLSHS